MSINRTPKTWGTEALVSPDLNAEIKALWTGLQAAWDSYTPAWTAATANPAIGDGTITGHYLQIGKTVLFEVVITMGSTTTYGSGQYRVSLPVSPTARTRRFTVDYLDTSNGGALLGSGRVSSSLCLLYAPSTTAGAYDRAATSAVPFAFASGDVITISGIYEAA